MCVCVCVCVRACVHCACLLDSCHLGAGRPVCLSWLWVAILFQAAEKLLVTLGALSEDKGGSGCVVTRITKLGRVMAQFPVSPRYSKMLSLGSQHDCLPYVVTLVSILSVKVTVMSLCAVDSCRVCVCFQEMFVDSLDTSEGEEVGNNSLYKRKSDTVRCSLLQDGRRETETCSGAQSSSTLLGWNGNVGLH